MNRVSDDVLEDMISRRIANSGETRAQARKAILAVIDALNSGKLELEVFDESGAIIGVRDKDGYHPNANDPARRGKS